MNTLSLSQAADFLKVHPSTLRARAAAGIVRGFKPGRAWVFKEEDLIAYLETTCPSTSVTAPAIGGSSTEPDGA
jgi:excisionase family DNA binding protein